MSIRGTNRARYSWALATILFHGLVPGLARADILEPKHIEYTADSDREGSSAQCVISLAIVNYPELPEIGNFRAFFAVGPTTNGRVGFVGFTLDIGKQNIVNGAPVGVEKVPLAKAVFSSSSFSSAGRMYEMDMKDGGYGGTTNDAATVFGFLGAIEEGNYDLSFMTKDGLEQRTYHISGTPPGDVIQKFEACMDSLKQ